MINQSALSLTYQTKHITKGIVTDCPIQICHKLSHLRPKRIFKCFFFEINILENVVIDLSIYASLMTDQNMYKGSMLTTLLKNDITEYYGSNFNQVKYCVLKYDK